jgi:hypothetical protein
VYEVGSAWLEMPPVVREAILAIVRNSRKIPAIVERSENGSTCSRLEEDDPNTTRALSSSFANHLSGLFIIAHSDEAAMPQVPGIRPFEKCDLADQLRCDPATLLHFLCG